MAPGPRAGNYASYGIKGIGTRYDPSQVPSQYKPIILVILRGDALEVPVRKHTRGRHRDMSVSKEASSKQTAPMGSRGAPLRNVLFVLTGFVCMTFVLALPRLWREMRREPRILRVRMQGCGHE